MSFWEIKAKDDKVTEVLIYSEIGEDYWGDGSTVDAKKFVSDIGKIKAKDIHLRINSPGGSVFDGTSIYNALKRHPATVTTYIDGVAASIASVIALAGSRVVIAPNAYMMIHEAQGFVGGQADDLRKYADVLDKINTSLVDTYAAKTGKKTDEIMKAVSAETWFTGKEAVEWGLADELGDETKDITAISHFSAEALTRHTTRGVPDSLVARLKIDPAKVRPVHPAANNNEEDPMDVKTMAITLGLSEDATEEEVLTRAQELAEGETPDPDPKPGEDDDNAGDDDGDGDEPTAKVNVPKGMKLIDEATLAELRANATQGAEARALQIKAERDEFLDAAILNGKFPPARRDHYAKLMEKDDAGTREFINDLAEGLIPVTEVVGHSVDPKNGAVSDSYPSEWLPEINDNKVEA